MLFLLLAWPLNAFADSPWPDLEFVEGTVSGAPDSAVIVGIEDYAYLDDIPGAEENARDWYRYLTIERGIPTERVRLLLSSDGVDHRVVGSLREMAQSSDPTGTLWFVFIGHGAPAKDQQDGLLVGADADRSPDGILFRSIPRSLILEVLENGSQGHTAVVLDACFSGQSSQGTPLVEGLQPVVPTRAAYPPGLTVMTAGQADEYAGPLPGAPRPAFSYLLLGALLGWGDTDGNGEVTAREAVTYAEQTLRSTVRGRRQVPQLSGEEPHLALGVGTSPPPDVEDIVLAVSGGTRGTTRADVGVELDFGSQIENKPSDETGFLVVHADPPDATIHLNGEEVGSAPVQLEKMVGRYVVVAVAPGYHPTRKEIRLQSSGIKLSMALEPAFGGLVIGSDPAGAEVVLGGEVVGHTPLSIPRKPSSTYALQIRHPFHKTWDGEVEVRDGELAQIQAVLDPNYGTLQVSSQPPRALISLNGASTGKTTPHRFAQVQPGVTVVGLELDAHLPFAEQVRIVNQTDSRVDASLDPMLGTLVITALDQEGRPCQAEVALDGAPIGTTPLKTQVPVGGHTVRVSYRGVASDWPVSLEHNARTDLEVDIRVRPPQTLPTIAWSAKAGDCSCALTDEGEFVCWGGGYCGKNMPQGIFERAFVGPRGRCAITADGRLACGFSNGSFGPAEGPAGEFERVVFAFESDRWCALRRDATSVCGSGSTLDRESQDRVRDIAVGTRHSCAVRIDGGITCWGDGDDGKTAAPRGAFKQASVGTTHSCGLRTDGEIVCWGSNQRTYVTGYERQTVQTGVTYNEAGSPQPTYGTREVAITDTEQSGQSRPPEGNFDRIVSYKLGNAAVREDGRIVRWGYGEDSGECQKWLTRVSRPLGASLAPVGSFERVAVQEDNVCAIRTSGALACWSDRDSWGTSLTGTPPAGIAVTGDFRDVAVIPGVVCALDLRGRPRCWKGAKSVSDLPAGPFRSLASNTAQIYGWSHEGDLQLLASLSQKKTQYEIPPHTALRSVSLGSRHACGIGTDGATRCWGRNSDGEATPPAGETFSQIAVGTYSTCGLRGDGSVDCWGEGKYASLGSARSGSFEELLGHSCGRRADGTVRCWGRSKVAKKRKLPGTFSAAASTWRGVCGVDPSGALACTHTEPPRGSHASLVAAEGQFCALGQDGALRCWGTLDIESSFDAGSPRRPVHAADDVPSPTTR